MTELTTLERIAAVVAAYQGIDKAMVKIESSLEDLGADSMDRVEIAFAVEEEFDTEFLDAEIEDIKTVQDIVALVETKLRAK